jgi:hypothetical protein
MYASTQSYHESAVQIRSLARLMAITIVALWTVFFVAELFHDPAAKWPLDLYLQGAILAVIFIGYASGWRKELIGGWLAIGGTIAFIAAVIATDNYQINTRNTAWFAVPGLLYLMARHFDRRAAKPIGWKGAERPE